MERDAIEEAIEEAVEPRPFLGMQKVEVPELRIHGEIAGVTIKGTSKPDRVLYLVKVTVFDDRALDQEALRIMRDSPLLSVGYAAADGRVRWPGWIESVRPGDAEIAYLHHAIPQSLTITFAHEAREFYDSADKRVVTPAEFADFMSLYKWPRQSVTVATWQTEGQGRLL